MRPPPAGWPRAMAARRRLCKIAVPMSHGLSPCFVLACSFPAVHTTQNPQLSHLLQAEAVMLGHALPATGRRPLRARRRCGRCCCGCSPPTRDRSAKRRCRSCSRWAGGPPGLSLGCCVAVLCLLCRAARAVLFQGLRPKAVLLSSHHIAGLQRPIQVAERAVLSCRRRRG